MSVCGFWVSMHLLVPGAYRQLDEALTAFEAESQCTFWCRVLTDGTHARRVQLFG